MLSQEDQEYLASNECVDDFFSQKKTSYEFHGTSNPDHIKPGLKVLPAGALYSALEILREMGSPNPSVVWARRYANGNVHVSFTGICFVSFYKLN